MPKASRLPALSSNQVIKALIRCGYTQERQTGSHVLMVRVLPDGKHPIPVVHPVKRIPFGTLKSYIEKAAGAGITEEHFLSKVK